jgi:hypothetical protein
MALSTRSHQTRPLPAPEHWVDKRVFTGAEPLVGRGERGLKIRGIVCAFLGHRPNRPDSTGEARCLRCLRSLDAATVDRQQPGAFIKDRRAA